MRIKFLDRFLSAMAGLFLLFIGATVFIYGVGIFPFELNLSVLRGPYTIWQRLIMVVVALLLIVLGIHGLSLLLRKRRENGFITQNSEFGNVSISMSAMENMIRRCIDTREELKVTHTRIHRARESVAVDIWVTLANGVNIPLTVTSLQKQIKHYITSCSGVDVKEVRVLVEVNNDQKPMSAEVIAPDLLAAEASGAAQAMTGFEGHDRMLTEDGPDKTPIHQRLFKHDEVQQAVSAPIELVMPDADPAADNTDEEQDNPAHSTDSPDTNWTDVDDGSLSDLPDGFESILNGLNDEKDDK